MHPETVAGFALLALAAAHSILGEVKVVRPLLEGPLDVPGSLIRFAWHVTSVAWVGIALHAFGAPLAVELVIAAGIPAVAGLVALRWHVGWPLFLLCTLAALRHGGWLPNRALELGAQTTIAVLVIVAGPHLYWAFGGTQWLVAALPIGRDGVRVFEPGRVATGVVALLLAVFAAILVIILGGGAPWPLRWMAVAGVVVLIVRAVGDGRLVGFSKTVRRTAFSVRDDRFYTPLVVLLALGATGALVL